MPEKFCFACVLCSEQIQCSVLHVWDLSKSCCFCLFLTGDIHVHVFYLWYCASVMFTLTPLTLGKQILCNYKLFVLLSTGRYRLFSVVLSCRLRGRYQLRSYVLFSCPHRWYQRCSPVLSRCLQRWYQRCFSLFTNCLHMRLQCCSEVWLMHYSAFYCVLSNFIKFNSLSLN